MKKTIFALACAIVAFCACDKEPAPATPTPPFASVETPYTGTVKAGIPESVTIAGTGFEATDVLYLGWGENSEEVEAFEITETQIKFGIDAYSAAKGQTVKAYLKRGEEIIELTGDITVTAPTVADGFIPDRALLDKLYANNAAVRAMVGPCRLIDVEAAAELVQDDSVQGGILAVDWTEATSFEGLELFSSLGTGLTANGGQEFMNFICWWCPNIEEMDFSNWDAYVQVRAGNCAKLKKVVLGPNMRGGSFEGSPIEHFDMHLARFADWVQNIGNAVDAEKYPDYQGVKYANLARTYIEGGTYGEDFNHWRGSGNVMNIKFAPDAEIHVDDQLIMHQWSGGGVVAAIKTAWKNGATVIVHNTNNYDDYHTVDAYSVNPNALNKTCDEGCCPPDEF